MQQEKVIIIGAGPCGMSCAIELQNQGIKPLIIEKENIVNTIYNFPTHQQFFSSSENLEIGHVPFITEKRKPIRNEALAYYRSVAERKQLRIHSFEKVIDIQSVGSKFHVITENNFLKQNVYEATEVIIATGYYDQPNAMEVPGENLPKVMHYFKEAHPYFNKDVVIVGGKNSAVDAALELYHVGARVTVLYRGHDYSKSIKPWILPEYQALVRKNNIDLVFNAHVKEIKQDTLIYVVHEKMREIKNDFVFAMTGYQPNINFLKKVGIKINEHTGIPYFNEHTFETNVKGLYIAGVIASGFNNNHIFIENGRFHGASIAQAIISSISG